jgi:uncharacterized membrane protein
VRARRRIVGVRQLARRPAAPPAVVVSPLGEVGAPAGRAALAPPPGISIVEAALAALRAEEDEDSGAAHAAHELDRVVHGILAVGLGVSAALMVAGVLLGVVLGRAMPESMPAIGEIPARIAALRPSGFLALGLLVLITTPVLRVVGSVLAFAHERDWRYAGVTALVLLVLTASLLVGRG